MNADALSRDMKNNLLCENVSPVLSPEDERNRASCLSTVPVPGVNPFVARKLRPGVIPYLFSGNENLGLILQNLKSNRWIGQIVGPHGSGKSTLIRSLETPLLDAGRRVERIRIACRRRVVHGPHQNVEIRNLPAARHSFRHVNCQEWNARTQLIVDGWEQLSWSTKWLLRFQCVRRRCGLLVTTHVPLMGLPLLYRTRVDLRTARRMIRMLAGTSLENELSDDEICRLLKANSYNMRELLFGLYDWYESRPICASERQPFSFSDP